MELELPSITEIDQTEKSEFLDTVHGLVVKKFQEKENKKKNSIEITADDIRNATRMEEINEDNVELIKKFFEEKEISVTFPYIDGESGIESFQFTIPPEETV